MKHILSFTFIFTCALSMGWAQTGKISGTVTSSSNQTVPYVNVILANTNYGTLTDKNGLYHIDKVSPGKYTLMFSSVGYGTLKKEVIVRAGSVSQVNAFLKEERQQLGEVVLEGHHNKYISREPSASLRLKTEIAKLPQNIQVIGGELLQDQQVTSIMDGVIRNVSGVTIREHWGNFASVLMRGFRIPAFKNGFNFNDTWGPLADDMAFVERIEFVKGPAGFMMSAGEPGGFYNVVTKKPTEKRIAQVSLMAGSFDLYRASLDLGGKLTNNGKLLYRFNALYQSSDTHRGNEESERYGIAPALTYQISDKTSITTELNYHNAESYLGSAYVFAPVADGYGSLDRNFKFTDTNYPATEINELAWFTNFKHDFSENWGVQSQFALFRYEQEGNSAWVFDPDGPGPLNAVNENGDVFRYANIWDALSLGKFLQTYLYGKFKTGNVSHNTLAGFDFTEREYFPDFFTGFFPVDTTAPFNIYNPVYGNTPDPVFDRSLGIKARTGNYEPYDGFTNRSLYLQDEIGFLNNKVRITLAGRYTNLTTVGKAENDTKFTPRAGFSVDVTPSLTVYGLYDESFLPNFGISRDSEPLDPVKATDIEGGIKGQFFEGRLRASLGAFLITKQDIAISDPDDPTFTFSILQDEIQSKGLEFDLQGEITPELSVTLNYANTNVEVTEDSLFPQNVGNRIAGHAKHLTNGWFNYSFAPTSKLKGFGASLGYQYQVDRSTWSWGADDQSDLPDYFRLDGALSWQNKHLRIQLNVNNLLDEYLYSGANFASYLYWQSEPGINGRLGVTYTF